MHHHYNGAQVMRDIFDDLDPENDCYIKELEEALEHGQLNVNDQLIVIRRMEELFRRRLR